MSITNFNVKNYIFITFGNTITFDKEIFEKGITPETKIVYQLNNSNYYDLSKNSYRFLFIYDFKLDDFINLTNNINPIIISQDQIRLNFNTPLVIKPNKYLKLNYILTHPKLSNKYSIQYGESGITLGKYTEGIIKLLQTIANKCPVNMSKINEYHPEYYVCDYDYLDLDGKIKNVVKKYVNKK